jgi:phage terminase small subunit
MPKGDKINTRQRLFCIEYLKDLNATQAAIRAGYSADTARRIGPENLSKRVVQNELSNQIEEMLIQSKIPVKKMIFGYWMKRAFYDITDIISTKGVMKMSDKRLKETGLSVCIDSINKKTDAKGKDIITYEFANKDKAIEMLSKYIQMIKEEQPVSNTTNNNKLISLKTLIVNQVKASPQEGDRIIGELEKLTGYTE